MEKNKQKKHAQAQAAVVLRTSKFVDFLDKWKFPCDSTYTDVFLHSYDFDP